MALRLLQFLALVLTALTLVPSGAHFFELPNKIDLPQEAYFIVQKIYRGWQLFGLVLSGALIANLTHAVVLRRQGKAFSSAAAAFLCVAASLVIFFVWTYPANVATENWSKVPSNWIDLRRQWEYSHAVNAVLSFAALCCATLSVLMANND